MFSRNQVNITSFWAYDLTDGHSAHLPEVLSQISALSSWRSLSSRFCVLFCNKSWLNLKQSHKKWPWNFICLRGGVQSKINSSEPLDLTLKPWTMAISSGGFKILRSSKTCLCSQRDRERGREREQSGTGRKKEKNKTLLFCWRCFPRTSQSEHLWYACLDTLSLGLETFLWNATESVRISN